MAGARRGAPASRPFGSARILNRRESGSGGGPAVALPTFSRSSNAGRAPAVVRCHHRLEDALAAFDDGGRAHVVVVAHDEDALDAGGVEPGRPTAQDFGGEAATAEGGPHAVPHVATLLGQGLVELVADGDPADDLSVDLGQQEVRVDRPRDSWRRCAAPRAARGSVPRTAQGSTARGTGSPRTQPGRPGGLLVGGRQRAQREHGVNRGDAEGAGLRASSR